MTFSRESAQRLAFGAPFDRTPQDAARARTLAARTLELAPHMAWTMPQELTWREDPFKEPNWVTQFHMLRWLDPFRRETVAGHHDYTDAWLAVAESWIEHNPPGQGQARYAWADMVEAVRAMTFCFALPMLQDHRPEKLDAFLTSIHQHGEWLADGSNIRRGNHGLQQHQGLLVIGAVLQEPQWVQIATQRAVEMLRESYDEQGINEEGAVQYHQMNFTWWHTMRKRLQVVSGNTPEEFDRIALAPLGLAHAARPDGTFELIGDTEAVRLRDVGHPAVDYVRSGGAEGVAPAERVKVFDAGYVFGRSTWGTDSQPFPDADFYSLRFGPQNRIHGHVDGMALTLYAGNGPMLVDSGKYAYDRTDPFRAHLQSRQGHNSLSVAGAAYDKTAVVTLEQHVQRADLDYYRFQDPGYPGVSLVREVCVALEHQLIVVVDSFTSDNPARVSQWWHLDPEAGRRTEGDSIFVRGKTNAFRIAWPEDPQRSTRVRRGSKSPIQGWFSPRWRVLQPTRVVESVITGQSGSLATALSYRNPARPHHLTEVTDHGGPRTFRVQRGGSEALTVVMDPDQPSITPAESRPED